MHKDTPNANGTIYAEDPRRFLRVYVALMRYEPNIIAGTITTNNINTDAIVY